MIDITQKIKKLEKENAALKKENADLRAECYALDKVLATCSTAPASSQNIETDRAAKKAYFLQEYKKATAKK